MDGLEEKIEIDVEGLKKLLQKMLPNGDKVFHETHDEKKGNVNHDFRDTNFGLKTNLIPKN